MDNKIGKPKDQNMFSLFLNKHFNLVLYIRKNILTSILALLHLLIITAALS